MRALDRLIPHPRLVEIDSVSLAAPADRVWQTVRHDGIPAPASTRALFALRTGHFSARSGVPFEGFRMDDLVSTEEKPGFQILVEDPPHEVAAGAIGKVWQLEIPFVHAGSADGYAGFATPGFVKVAWAVRVEPRGPDRTHVEFELRVDATSDAAWQKFERYFVLVGPPSRFIRHSLLKALSRAVAAPAEPRTEPADVLDGLTGAGAMAISLLTPFLRDRRTHWGAGQDASRRTFPGDDLLDARWSWTHGIEINAPPDQVWPWIAQVGADRGGFYSYEWLENLAGCRLQNASAIHSAWQVHEGEEVSLHPGVPAAQVVDVQPERYFLMHAPPDASARAAGKPWVAMTWLFLIEPIGDSRCRLISRYRATCSDDLMTRLSFGPTLAEPVGYVMDRRMLEGVKARAERHAAATSAA